MELILAAAGFILLSMFMRMIFRNILTIMIIIAFLYLLGLMTSPAHSRGFPTLQDDLRQDRIERYFHPQCEIKIRNAIIQNKSSDEVATIARNCSEHQSNPYFEMCKKTPGYLEK